MVAGFLLVVGLGACAEEPEDAAATELGTTTSEGTGTTAEPDALISTTRPEGPAPVVTLETLTEGIELPWQWGNWTVDEFGYPSQFAVRYDGDHLFGIYPFGERIRLDPSAEASVDQAAIEAFCGSRLQRNDFSHSIETVEFFGHPAVQSVWVSPASGPAEDVFVELYFHRAEETMAYLSASNHEWDTIDARAVAAFAPVFGQFVAAFAQGPSAASSRPPPTVDALGEVPPGQTCPDLAEEGFSYRQAVAYWLREGRPATMDPTGSGVPCESEYPPFAVELVYRDPAWPTVQFATTVVADGQRRFAATGPAVDAGVVCAGGTVDEVVGDDSADEYSCDDGSGTFTVVVRRDIEGNSGSFGTWSTNLAGGSGSYEWLDGGGGALARATPAGAEESDLYGRIAINPVG